MIKVMDKFILSLIAMTAATVALAAEKHYDFRARLNCVHEKDRRDVLLKPTTDEFVFADGVRLVIPESSDEVL